MSFARKSNLHQSVNWSFLLQLLLPRQTSAGCRWNSSSQFHTVLEEGRARWRYQQGCFLLRPLFLAFRCVYFLYSNNVFPLCPHLLLRTTVILGYLSLYLFHFNFCPSLKALCLNMITFWGSWCSWLQCINLRTDVVVLHIKLHLWCLHLIWTLIQIPYWC